MTLARNFKERMQTLATMKLRMHFYYKLRMEMTDDFK